MNEMEKRVQETYFVKKQIRMKLSDELKGKHCKLLLEGIGIGIGFGFELKGKHMKFAERKKDLS